MVPAALSGNRDVRGYHEAMTVLAGGAVTAALLLLSVWVHKVGHALAYRDLGIGRAVVRYGAPMAPRMIRQPTTDRPWGVVVTPWLVTGHVQPAVTAEQAGSLAFPDLALYASGGVIMSLVTGCGLLAGWAFFAGAVYPAIGWAVACGAGWAWRRRLAAVLCTAGPVILLGTELWALTGGLHERGARGLAGLLDIHSLTAALFAAGVLSLCAGIFSMLPFPQFDGGQMLRVGLGLWRGEKSAAVYEVTRSAVLVAVIAIAVLADVLGVVG
jgi:hypothetical protein